MYLPNLHVCTFAPTVPRFQQEVDEMIDLCR